MTFLVLSITSGDGAVFWASGFLADCLHPFLVSGPSGTDANCSNWPGTIAVTPGAAFAPGSYLPGWACFMAPTGLPIQPAKRLCSGGGNVGGGAAGGTRGPSGLGAAGDSDCSCKCAGGNTNPQRKLGGSAGRPTNR
ncbi:MAG TPA: hypothetical protein VMV69_18795 [Pirellulales bacterium]|nr:hypothetical protein [Pirellulales bacterium]